MPTLSNGTWSENKGRQLSRDNKTDGGEKDKLQESVIWHMTEQILKMSNSNPNICLYDSDQSVSWLTLPKSVSLSSDYIRICPAGDCLRTLFDMYIIIINTPWENKDINQIMELMTHPSKMLLLKAKASCPTKWRSCRKREQKTRHGLESAFWGSIASESTHQILEFVV